MLLNSKEGRNREYKNMSKSEKLNDILLKDCRPVVFNGHYNGRP
jgi:hypothetical protein